MRVSKFEHMDVGFSQGNLSLVEIFEVNYISKGRTMALWRCQCGFQFRSSLWSVLLSKKHCCGCSKVIGNVGTTIKNWLVVDFLGRNKCNNFTFKLLCNTCGKEKVVTNTTMMNSLNACNHKTRLKQNHPMRGSRTYSSWENMIQRVTNPNSPQYDRYMGRGITMDSRWALFSNFLLDMGERPEGMSLDRIDNDGNYTKSNCKWSTQKEQCVNRGKDQNSYSIYKGAYYRKDRGTWFSNIKTPEGVVIHLGKFEDEISAARAWDDEAKKYGYVTNVALGLLCELNNTPKTGETNL